MSIAVRCFVSSLLLFGMTAHPAAADPFAVLYKFHAEVGGHSPTKGLSTDAEGNLYGETYYGGRGSDCGTIFTLTKMPGGGWTHKVLVNLGLQSGVCHPISRPVVAGEFVYDTAYATQGGGGIMFRAATSGGGYKTLHEFSDYPTGSLLVDANGTLHGTTPSGGRPGCDNGQAGDDGTLYRIGPNGAGFRVSHFFSPRDGAVPMDDPLVGPDGAIYGAASGYDRCPGQHPSVIYRKSTDGYSVLHDFAFNVVPPGGQMAFGPQGTLYGTQKNHVWMLKPGSSGQPWTYTVIHHFDAPTEGQPYGVVRDRSGNLYGISKFRKGHSTQLLYRLSPPVSGTEWTFTILHDFGLGQELFPNGFGVNYQLLLSGDVLYGSAQYGGEKSQKYDLGGGVVFRYSLF